LEYFLHQIWSLKSNLSVWTIVTFFPSYKYTILTSNLRLSFPLVISLFYKFGYKNSIFSTRSSRFLSDLFESNPRIDFLFKYSYGQTNWVWHTLHPIDFIINLQHIQLILQSSDIWFPSYFHRIQLDPVSTYPCHSN